MDPRAITAFLSGTIFCGYGIIGLFFWRFWTKTKDALFACFGVAFWLLAGERLMLIKYGLSNPHCPQVYLARLAAFLIIIVGIVAKNRKSQGR